VAKSSGGATKAVGGKVDCIALYDLPHCNSLIQFNSSQRICSRWSACNFTLIFIKHLLSVLIYLRQRITPVIIKDYKRNLLRVNMKFMVFILSISLSFFGHAIVIRHDVTDEKYLAKQIDFPPLATFYIDGAHGTLIKPNWVLTAAHATFCVQTGSFIRLAGKTRKVSNVYVNPDYTPGKSHDIALIQLQDDVTDVSPAAVYTKSDELGKNIWFIGIGGTGTGLKGQTIDNAENKGMLRRALNTIVAAQGPLIKFKFDQGENALPLEGVSGGGDSGGPAYIRNDYGYQLLGISSRPEGNFENIGEYGITEVYTRVSYFSAWINQVIEASADDREKISLPKLTYLPAGVTEDILPMVCNDIGIKSDEN
jgi:hypothetical protein